jgi:hypothetical protein
VAVLVALETLVMNPFLGVFFSFRHETVVFSQADKAVNLCVVVSGGAVGGGGAVGTVDVIHVSLRGWSELHDFDFWPTSCR